MGKGVAEVDKNDRVKRMGGEISSRVRGKSAYLSRGVSFLFFIPSYGRNFKMFSIKLFTHFKNN